jgi:hypothetical protein
VWVNDSVVFPFFPIRKQQSFALVDIKEKISAITRGEERKREGERKIVFMAA